MKLRYKILTTLLALVAIGVAALALTLSYTAPCQPMPPPSAGAAAMTAVTYTCYGSPDVLQLAAVDKPVPGDDQVVVRVRAAAVNPYDWHFMRGSPYLMRLESGIGRPSGTRLGVDYAGTVDAVGRSVSRFKPGDEVFGGTGGAWAEYVVTGENAAIAAKPGNASFAEAAAVPIAGVTALQAVRDKGRTGAGDNVLINGASGGVGTFAVQIAKSYGAEVTGVCSTRNVDMVRSLGADHVIDYRKENFTESGQRYDVIIDMVGNHPLSALRSALVPGGILVIVGAPPGDWFRPLLNPLKAMVVDPFVDEEIGFFVAEMTQEDLSVLGGLMADGTVTPVLDRHYPLADIAEAVAYSEDGHASGKIIIDIP